ncbi:MAG: MBL fold metallo-hydrolase, partial [Verrucomicrobia bacterium]|nr:MBL fold metallo-hydrolase [Verrucomicrobiota bacterium]
PEGFLDFLKEEKIKPDSLLLTHGHWDHIWDAADLADWAGCPVYYHPDTAFLCLQPDSMLGFGLPQRLRPVPATQLLEESGPIPASWGNARLLLVPGHCPGSLCLYLPGPGQLYGGDVLFAEGVGSLRHPEKDPHPARKDDCLSRPRPRHHRGPRKILQPLFGKRGLAISSTAMKQTWQIRIPSITKD